MSLLNCPVPIYGDMKFRGKCPVEAQEQVTFFARLRRDHPTTWGVLALHPRNEGLRFGAQIGAVTRHKAEGMAAGASDIIIPAKAAFVCEMKRRDPTLSAWQDGQREYLAAAQDAGAFACVALGVDAAWEAFGEWVIAQRLA